MVSRTISCEEIAVILTFSERFWEGRDSSSIDPGNELFGSSGIFLEICPVLLRKILIQIGDNKQYEIGGHQERDHQHDKAVGDKGESGEKNRIAEIVHMHRIPEQTDGVESSLVVRILLPEMSCQLRVTVQV